MTAIGIRGIALYLPPIVRGNDWWPESTVAAWDARRAATPMGAAPAPPGPITEGMARVLAALAEHAGDPFQGVRERRVMPDGMTATDMEVAAAEQAIDRAGIDRGEIDLLLVHTIVPEHQMGNTACLVHERLGLRPACFAMQTEAAGYSFLMQLTIAQQMIAGGQARYALLVQSSSVSRLIDPEDPISPIFGDAAAATVVGAVSASRGMLGAVHRADGRYPRSLIASVRGKRWHDDGRVVLHSADPEQAREVFLGTVDRGKEVADEVLARAGFQASDVDFFAVHQGPAWLRPVARDHLGLTAAKTTETFSFTGHISSVTVPAGLAIAENQGVLGADDLVLMFAGGTGQTYGAALVRWGS